MKRTVVVKMGGSTLDAEDMLNQFAEGVSRIPADIQLVIVHGGGKDIGRQLTKMGREFRFIDGLRVTDDEVIDVVEMVLSGLVNKWITRALERRGIRAAGISGTDRGLFRAVKLESPNGDLGYVGTIEAVNTELIDVLLEKSITPVVSPISAGPEGRAYNINADHAAQRLAEAWHADDLIYITDVPGISVCGSIQERIRLGEIDELIASGEITGGMIPKVTSCGAAVRQGVRRVHIIGWDGPESIVRSLAETSPAGTIIEE